MKQVGFSLLILLFASHPAGAQSPADTPLSVTGFFDVQATRLPESDNMFSLGPFEVDLELLYSDRVSMSAAVVVEDGAAEAGPAFVDIHLFQRDGAAHSPRGALFALPGLHVQLGSFDVPFGVDYQFYASPDRLTISAPLSTDFLEYFDGGWTDIGVRAYTSHPWYNFTAYTVNGNAEGYAAGGRIGITPFRSFEADGEDIPVVELGVSGNRDVDDGSEEEFTLFGADLGCNLHGFHLLAEYVASDNAADDITQESSYAQVNHPLPLVLAIGYARFDTFTATLPGSDDLRTDRVTVGIRRDFFDAVILKLEYQRYLEDECELADGADHLAAQVVATF